MFCFGHIASVCTFKIFEYLQSTAKTSQLPQCSVLLTHLFISTSRSMISLKSCYTIILKTGAFYSGCLFRVYITNSTLFIHRNDLVLISQPGRHSSACSFSSKDINPVKDLGHHRRRRRRLARGSFEWRTRDDRPISQQMRETVEPRV